ncbi:MAG: DUF4836 family protein [Kordia sp.]|uniref:DUF4836 family protein n=1 Tax=Kordia sp. TaxID=1965332 RepID=UPI0038597F60
MKKILCLFAIALMMVSCGGTKSSGTSFIPKDAIGVMYVNLESLSQKSSTVDFKNLSISKMINESAPRELKEFMNTQMTAENMKATFRNDFMLGFMSFDRMSPSGGFVIPIKDAASFQKMIQPMLDKMPRMEKQESVGKDNAFTVCTSRDLAIGWNDQNALIVISDRAAAQTLIDLTKLESSNMITATDYFSGFFDGSKDMGIHISSTPVSDLASSFLTNFGANMDLKNNNFMYHTTFEEDRLFTSAKFKMNDDMKSIIGYESWMSTGYNADLLKMMPNNAAMLVKASIDPTAMYKHIEGLQNSSVLPDMVKSQIKRALSGMNREMNREMGMTMEELAGIFEGSMMMSMTEGVNVQATRYTYDEDYNRVPETYTKKQPYIYAAVSIKDQAKFDSMLDVVMKQETPMATKGKNYYQLEKDLFAVIKNKVLFVTNDGSKADEIYNNGKLASNLSGFEHKDKLDNSMYVYMNENFTEMYSDIINSMNPYASYARGGLNMDAANDIYSKYFGDTHMTMSTDGMEMYSYTKGEGNSLVNIIKYMDVMMQEVTKMVR